MCHTCRGCKVVTKFFPNQAADLEPVLALLDRLTAAARPRNPAAPMGS